MSGSPVTLLDNESYFGPSMCIRDVSSCEWLEHSSLYHQYCIDQFDLTKRSELEGIFRACLWEKSSETSDYKQGPSIEMYEDVFASMEQCTDQGWYVFRMGPFTSTGGFNWMYAHIMEVAHKDWPDPGLVADVTRYFVGTMSVHGEIVGFPPIHVHHFHIEENSNVFVNKGSLITHGDDECLSSAGGPACNIRSMPPGYATWLKLPFRATFELNDVRPAGSPPLQSYGVIALRIASIHSPHAPALKPFSQTRLRMTPLDPDVGHGGTYQVVPRLASASVFYEEYEFTDYAELLWSYGHTHPLWVSEMFFFVNTTATVLDLKSAIGRGQQLRKGLNISQVRLLRQGLARRGLSNMVCHWDREKVPYEVLPGTFASGSTFNRKGSCCRPFKIFPGLTAVGVVILAPWSKEAAKGDNMDKAGFASIHTFFRFFTSTQNPAATALALNPALLQSFGDSKGDFQEEAAMSRDNMKDYAVKYKDYLIKPIFNDMAKSLEHPLDTIQLIKNAALFDFASSRAILRSQMRP
eukprot:CAMPEP_0119299620 /NCGR_PEP_ID=MMETSP1333-20130426/1676_1 /TAXON_ID=418940 /ORGANISM="Scyphosphaera apsteinii, Strain RCC1455" /LENGTH=522 /DNA_ID=CAMNT_0007301107 /DNA_START=122 /DNA_END=1690 /DNA_ORIENTATION=+